MTKYPLIVDNKHPDPGDPKGLLLSLAKILSKLQFSAKIVKVYIGLVLKFLSNELTILNTRASTFL